MYYLRFLERKGNRTGLVRALSLNRKIWSLLRLSSAINGIQSTPALRTPRYYEHPAITDSSKIPGESYRRLTEINSRYYGLSLLRTYGHFIRSQRHNFIVFSLVVIADTEQHLGIFARFLRLSYLSFLVDFRFFCLSIKILCSLAAMNKFVQSVMIQMVDRPNTTPIGQDKKTLTLK